MTSWSGDDALALQDGSAAVAAQPVEAIGAEVLGSDADAVSGVPGVREDLMELTKPRIMLLVLITAGLGYLLGVRGAAGAGIEWLAFVAMMLGSGVACMGAAALNQVMERDTDALMRRTRDRPVAAGRMTRGRAAAIGVGLAVLGVGVQLAFGLWLSAGLTAFTVLSYVLIYTPMKRWTTWALWVGAVPGAMPPIIGFAAATGTIGLEAWLVFGIMFIWQVPHFLAIAWLYREDYAAAGLAMLPVVQPDGRSTRRQAIVGCVLLIVAGLLPTWFGVCGWWMFAVATLAGTGFLVMGVAWSMDPSRARARRFFLSSLVYLPIVLAMMPMDLR
ncbi:MAG: heme o synthase [Planctomycetota bacterium]